MVDSDGEKDFRSVDQRDQQAALDGLPTIQALARRALQPDAPNEAVNGDEGYAVVDTLLGLPVID